MQKQKRFNQICKNIKLIKIQGAREITKAGFQAYELIPTNKSKQKILSLRPTEPMLEKALEIADKISYKELSKKLNRNQEIINKQVLKLIKNNSVIFTHCRSSTVIDALIYAKKKRKNFEVYNTETRPLYQGRKTAKQLRKAGIKTTMFTDSSAGIALTKSQKTKKVNFILFGADAITRKGVINKVGSGMFAQIAKANKIPVYILADSWKYTKEKIKLEKRNLKEIWSKAPQKLKIQNLAFELIEKNEITAIISELGNLSYNDFLDKVKRK